jgi:selenide,water dikinase
MPPPLTRDLILIGGGHAHALVLRKWGMAPLQGVRLTLINPGATAPYTGMLPGHIAGHYDRAELDIDLMRLCRFAGARLIDGRVCGIDPQDRALRLTDGREFTYDVASINVGITGDMPQIEGFAQFGTPAKPLGPFARKWADLLENAQGETHVAVIGGGIAGAELAMAMAHALRLRTGQAHVTLIEREPALTGLPPRAAAALTRGLQDRGITLVTGAQVHAVGKGTVTLAGGRKILAEFCVGAAGARPQDWIGHSQLPQADGFISVDEYLNVCGHGDLFAVGDCAHMAHAPRPKAGVFAVRAAPILFDNLRAALGTGRKRRFSPQRSYLKLVSLGGRSALGERGLHLQGRWLWQLKDHIDRRFMRRLHNLPNMPRPAATQRAKTAAQDSEQPLCGGCGSKIGADVLGQTLARLPSLTRPDVLTQPGDDAAILAGGNPLAQVLTTDHLRAVTDDAGLMARIAAVHALGDIWAMGAQPQAALAMLVLPHMAQPLQARTLLEIMQGAKQVFHASGCDIVGGHSSMGSELTIGFSISGLCAHPITHRGAQAGDAIILTRPIGSGTVLAGHMAGLAKGPQVLDMLHHMAQPQHIAAAALTKAKAMTDVTGFGLSGHLGNLCRASGVGAHLWLDRVPFYDSALALAAAGVRSTIYDANHQAGAVQGGAGPARILLDDPQTAGGLLAAVAPDQVDDVLAALPGARHIGVFVAGPPVISCRCLNS